MRTYVCHCGNVLFFDNHRCLRCEAEVGYCPVCRRVVGLRRLNGVRYRCGRDECRAVLVKCLNYALHDVCNRMVPEERLEPHTKPLCDACRFNRTIPDLKVAGNLRKWFRLEAAKRRLFYDLDLLSLPYGSEEDGLEPPLAFDFKADVSPQSQVWGKLWRRMGKGERVWTGHSDGTITINIREADEVEREKQRVAFGEEHRTLIGHFRHEIAHYYWDVLVKGEREEEFKQVFGDHEDPPYKKAIERYYKEGPPPDWRKRFATAYATMHPWEDFAETFALYLDMMSAIDTAHHMGFNGILPSPADDLDTLVLHYQRLAIGMNEMNRSMGLIDLVPEILVPPVVYKLRFIHRLVAEARAGRS